MKVSTRRVIAPIAALAAMGVALTGCASNSASPGSVGKADGVVTIQGPLTGRDATLLQKSWAGWEAANHITIKYSGSVNFEEQIPGEAQQGNHPDLAIFEQPGLINDLASRGYLQPLPSATTSNVKANFPASWATYTTVKGTDYAAPLLASVNGWIFYSPRQFASWGVALPSTWGQLASVTAAIQLKTGKASWCDGFEDGAVSGSAGTNWIEDLVLRQDGPKVYDQWVSHKIPFDDPRIKLAFQDASDLLLDSDFTNAGIGGAHSISTATTADVATAMSTGKCAMTHQASSFGSELTAADGKTPAKISADGDFWAFPLPPFKGSSNPITGAGDFVAAFSNDSDTAKVQQYLSSTSWARSRVKLGGVISPDKFVTPATASSPLLQASTQLLQDDQTVFRFDASDLMPSVVGSGSFLTGMVNWSKGRKIDTVLTGIDKSWPHS